MAMSANSIAKLYLLNVGKVHKWMNDIQLVPLCPENIEKLYKYYLKVKKIVDDHEEWLETSYHSSGDTQLKSSNSSFSNFGFSFQNIQEIIQQYQMKQNTELARKVKKILGLSREFSFAHTVSIELLKKVPKSRLQQAYSCLKLRTRDVHQLQLKLAQIGKPPEYELTRHIFDVAQFSALYLRRLINKDAICTRAIETMYPSTLQQVLQDQLKELNEKILKDMTSIKSCKLGAATSQAKELMKLFSNKYTSERLRDIKIKLGIDLFAYFTSVNVQPFIVEKPELNIELKEILGLISDFSAGKALRSLPEQLETTQLVDSFSRLKC